MSKKISLILLALLLAFAVAGCGGNQNTPPVEDSPDNPIDIVDPINELIMLYVPNENVDGFDVVESYTDGTAEDIIALLVYENAIPEGCDIISFVEDGYGGAVADMNVEYGFAISQGTTGEYIHLGCVVNTLLTYYNLDNITITIEGQVAETGHEIYDYPLSFYEDQVAYY
jgi:hypothetical protein